MACLHLIALLPALILPQEAPSASAAPAPSASSSPTADEPHPELAKALIHPDARRDHEALTRALRALAEGYPTLITGQTIGTSAGGTPITALVLSNDPEHAAERPGILVVAGLDGPRWATTEAALVLAETLAAQHAPLLGEVTVYVIPRANPDAAQAFLHGPRQDRSTNATPQDEDRDRRTDENPPADLNGDGFITMLRARNAPAPYANPTLVTDEADARLLRTPDPLKGEVPIYTIFIEGVDTDGDGLIAEDPAGGTLPDRSFPHRWPEFESGAGPFPLSAPESEALLRFVLEHPRLVSALVLGRQDTVVNVPDGRGRTEVGAPLLIGEEDAKAYAALAKLYREIVGQTRAAESDSAGSFVAWMNAQRGIPTFGAQLWGRPDLPNAEETAAPPPEEQEPRKEEEPERERERGGRGRGRGDRPRARDVQNRPPATSTDDAAWLAISDAQGGSGFVPWTTIEHPQLGQVEVGGWVPGWRENPPLDQVTPLGRKCARFVEALAQARPNVQLQDAVARPVAPGLYEISARLVNTGRMPTVQQGGRGTPSAPAHVVRLSPAIERIKSGQRVHVVRGLNPGESRPLRWLVTAPPEERIDLELLVLGQPLQTIQIRNGEVLQ